MKRFCFAVWTAFVSTAWGGGYFNPHQDGYKIDVADLSLSDSIKTSLAKLMAEYCAHLEPEQATASIMRSKLLATALLLDPENRAAILAREKLINDAPLSPSMKLTPDKTAKALNKVAGQLDGKNKNNTALQGVLLDLASDILPDNDDILYAYGVYKNKHGAFKWSNVFPVNALRAPANGTASKDVGQAAFSPGVLANPGTDYSDFKKTQAAVSGLFIQEIQGQFFGQPMDIIATVLPHHEPNQTLFSFSTAVGSEMRISHSEAINLIRTRHPELPAGRNVRISFADKYTPKDGGSAGLAFTLMYFSLLDDLTLDPAVTMTGDITIDWKVKKIGGTRAKIAGAHEGGKKIVIIPAENVEDLNDHVLLEGAGLFSKVQILSASNITEAVAVARADRATELQESLDMFAKLQKLAKQYGLKSMFRSKSALQALHKVYENCPNHVSAEYLIRLSKGWKPSKLSEEGTLSELLKLIQPYLTRYGSFMLNDNTGLTDKNVLERVKQASWIKGMASKRQADLAQNILEFTFSITDYYSATNPDNNSLKASLNTLYSKHHLIDRIRGMQKLSSKSKRELHYSARKAMDAVIKALRELSVDPKFLHKLVQ